MTNPAAHADFYGRFQSFWSDPSGPRVAEIIAPDAAIHFTGFETMTGAEYITAMGEMLASFDGLEVTPLDYAGNAEMLYISWRSSANIAGERREWIGVDRFRLKDGMAIEEHVIFDPTVLATDT